IIKGKRIEFEIKSGVNDAEGWIDEGNFKCPCCRNITPNAILKAQLVGKENKERLIAKIVDSPSGKHYELPTDNEISALESVSFNGLRPTEKLPITYSKGMAFCLWGFNVW